MARLLLIGTATTAIVAACYDKVPGPSAPLPPTKEAKPLGSKPKKIKPSIVQMNQKFSPQDELAAPQEETPAVPPPTKDVVDAGVSDVVDLPPIPDAGGLDAPAIKNDPHP